MNVWRQHKWAAGISSASRVLGNVDQRWGDGIAERVKIQPNILALAEN